MRPLPVLRVLPGQRPFYLISGHVQLPVVPLYSPLFTAVLVHGWYMEPTGPTRRGECGHPRIAGSSRVTMRDRDRSVVSAVFDVKIGERVGPVRSVGVLVAS